VAVGLTGLVLLSTWEAEEEEEVAVSGMLEDDLERLCFDVLKFKK
jgi:hypothetical protein